MSNEYIRKAYGIDVPVGAWVQHQVTGRFGIVRPEGETHLHYVKVQFEGESFASNCHPAELDYDVLPRKAGAA